MKARPILFNTDMVKAILAGQKTQTRREAKNIVAAPRFRSGWKAVRADGKAAVSTDAPAGLLGEACPFGQPGDLLYVREAWQGPLLPMEKAEEYWHHGDEKYESPEYCEYAADGGPRPEYIDCDENLRHVWRPSIHMPRWASRLTLEITDVRVERLQDIDRGDCMAEGCPFPNMAVNDPIGWFSGLWGSIYSNWDANPWVWVVEFKVHHCNVDALLRKREAA